MRRSLWTSLLGIVGITVAAFAAVVSAGWTPHLGLDLAGGASVVLHPARAVSKSTLNETINILNDRVNAYGVSSPSIGIQGSDIVVQMPGLKDARKVLSVIGETAQLEFRPVLCYTNPYQAPKKGVAPQVGPPSCSSTEQANPYNPSPPFDAALASMPTTSCVNAPANQDVIYAVKGANGGRYVLGPVGATGTIVKDPLPALNNGQWVVTFNMDSNGTAKWNAMAGAAFQKQIAIALDCQVISAPGIQTVQQGNTPPKSFTPFSGSQGVQISGISSQSAADNLALVLKFGALPVQLQQKTFQTVSATLGKSSLKAGLLAGIGGLVLVLLYTILYYRALGFVVFSGLILTAMLLWVITSVLSHSNNGLTLDLSGVTGIIVSIGITVDSYIVYFERLKDDIRSGKTIRTSVDKGFQRAYRTVLAADAVSLIGAVLLYWLTVGPVRGFALFLGISTILDVVTTYFFTRPIVILMGRSKAFTEARWIGVGRGLAPQDEEERELVGSSL